MVTIQENFSLASYNTFGVTAKASYFAKITDTKSLDELTTSQELFGKTTLVLGGGSNLLFTKDFDGLVLHSAIEGKEVIGENDDHYFVKVGSGENWHNFVMYCLEHNYGGVENLSLIPGSVGAAPIQNIGAYGVELKEVFHSLDAYNLERQSVEVFGKEECKFGYRDSIFKQEYKGKYLITSVTLKLTKKHELNTSYGAISSTLNEMGIDNPTIKSVSDAVIAIRQSKLPNPREVGNAGSFFKNPVIDKIDFEGLRAEFPTVPGYETAFNAMKVPAAWLIEKAGWKGFKKGKVGTYEKQPLVIVNHGTNGIEVWELAQEIRDSVEKMFGITLVPEVTVL